jgi:hypothetical protein
LTPIPEWLEYGMYFTDLPKDFSINNAIYSYINDNVYEIYFNIHMTDPILNPKGLFKWNLLTMAPTEFGEDVMHGAPTWDNINCIEYLARNNKCGFNGERINPKEFHQYLNELIQLARE